MRLSRMLLPTLKESPADAEVISHKLMVRAGMVRKVAAGIYTLLPMGLRVIRKVEAIVREEMVRAGAEELLMPFVQPAELWKESGRWEAYGKELLRINDRNGRDFCLSPTHEEVITDLVRHEIRSYRDLPRNLFQIQIKMRDEIRPRFGLMRGREFIMKDAYSFHATDESAQKEYDNMLVTYKRIFDRCGLEFKAVEADSGSIGGSFSHEFMVLADTGEDAIASCSECDYAANVEKAELSEPSEPASAGSKNDMEEVSTPGLSSIDEVSEFLKIKKSQMIKTLIYVADEKVVVALVRGDYEINEIKLQRAIGAELLELADEKKVMEVTGAPVGFAGPVGLKDVKIYADFSVKNIVDGYMGANKKDTHLKNVSPDKDFECGYFDLRVAVEGDSCPRCSGLMEIKRGIEVGHVFMLGTKYSTTMGANFLDENGKAQPVIMGCYGIGIGRVAAAAIEQNNDDHGIVWTKELSPFSCIVVPLDIKDDAVMKCAEDIYKTLNEKGIETLIDDRNERPGIKFKDSELIGIPVRVTIGSKTLANGEVEIMERAKGEKVLIKAQDAVEAVTKILGE